MKSLLNALQEGRLIELPDPNKETCLKYLAHIIEAIPDLGATAEVDEAVLARERAQNTSLGHGVACPHVRAAGSGELQCAVGWSPSGIDYGAKDGQKVHLVVMYYIPDSQKGAYLKEMAFLAGAIQKAGGIQAIAKAQDIGAVRESLLDWVSLAIDSSLPEIKAKMIRLEAKQAQAAALGESTAAAAAVEEVLSLLVVSLAEGKNLALCQDAGLAAAIESDPSLRDAIGSRKPFDKAGYRLVWRSSTSYGPRSLHDYVALKLT